MMEYSRKYRWAITGFVILLLLNIGTLTTIWLIRPPNHPPGRGEPRFAVGRYLDRELDLTGPQKEKLEELRTRHFEKTRRIMSQIRSERGAYFRQLNRSGKPVGGVARDSLARSIGENQLRLEEAVYAHFREIEKMLNEEQRTRFDRIIEQVMQRRRERGDGPGGQMGRFRGRGF